MHMLEAMKRQREEEDRRKQEELRKKVEEENKKMNETKASLTVLFSLSNLASALPEDFEKLKANYELTMRNDLPRTGMRREKLTAEADKTLRHATKYVEQVREQRSRFDAWKKKEEARKAEEA